MQKVAGVARIASLGTITRAAGHMAVLCVIMKHTNVVGAKCNAIYSDKDFIQFRIICG